jgi:hypothetical protein
LIRMSRICCHLHLSFRPAGAARGPETVASFANENTSPS